MTKWIETVLEWEVKNDMLEGKAVKGFAFYSYMRREFLNSILNTINQVPIDAYGSKEENKVKLFLKLLKKNEKTSMTHVDVCFLPHPRRQKKGDVYESIFTDFLTDDFPNSVSLERCFTDHSHFEPAYTQNLVYIDRIILKSYLYRILKQTFQKKEYHRIRQCIQTAMEQPLMELEQKLHIKIKKNQYYDRATTLYYFYVNRRKSYLLFLNQIAPKVIVEAVGKSFDAMLINEIAKERHIPTIEVQHCLLGPTSQYPQSVTVKQFPDYYLTFSDYWKQYAAYPIPKDHIIACGYPFFEQQVKEYPPKKTAGKKTILFISGLAYGRELSDLAVALYQLAGSDISIIYKLHSDEFKDWKTLYPKLLETNIPVIDNREQSIYAYFAQSDAQVGVFSTALYEGLAFDLTTYILDIPFAADFIDFCEEGYGTLVHSAKELLADIRDEASGKSLSSLFWKENAKENMITEIKKIMEEKREKDE